VGWAGPACCQCGLMHGGPYARQAGPLTHPYMQQKIKSLNFITRVHKIWENIIIGESYNFKTLL